MAKSQSTLPSCAVPGVKFCHRGHQKQVTADGRSVCPVCKSDGMKKYRAAKPELRKKQARSRQAVWRDKNRDLVRARAKADRTRIKIEVLGHYCSGEPACQCCGVMFIEFLTIDHVNGGGRQHREQVGSGGYRLYAWLKANGYPDGYRVMCLNCNCAIGFYGYCPHQLQARGTDGSERAEGGERRPDPAGPGHGV